MSEQLPGTPVPEPPEWREKALAMLQSPDRWPMWPFLPMKRRFRRDDGFETLEAGFSVTADYPTYVLRGFPSAAGVIAQLNVEDDGASNPWYEEHLVRRYETAEEMLDDGWAVD
jgi:hypothetical protein